jgi:hypothetical protein
VRDAKDRRLIVQTDRPRFRNDLVAQPIEEEGVRYVDVTDPLSGNTFRFYDVEYSIACAMDGARDLAALSEWTRTELGIETSADELVGVVSTLADLGYLDGGEAAGAGDSLATTAPPAAGDEEVADQGAFVASLGGGEQAVAELGSALDGVAAAVAGEPDASLELGPPGSPAAAAPGEPSVDIELGAPGKGDTSEDVGVGAPVEAPALDLGPPGASLEVETGEPAGASAPSDDGLEISPPAPTGDESSFEGLLEGAAAMIPPAAPRPAAPPIQPGKGLGAHRVIDDDEEPTKLPRPRSVVEDEDELPKPPVLGAKAEDEVSVDLSNHLSLSSSEVKEAVRSSRAMAIPELPKDLQIEADEPEEPQPLDREPGGARAALAEARAAAAEAALSPVSETPEQLVPLVESPGPAAGRSAPPPTPVTVLPPPPSTLLPSRPIEQPAASRSSAWIYIVLLLVVAGGVGVFVFKDKLFGGSSGGSYSGGTKPPAAKTDAGKGPVAAAKPDGAPAPAAALPSAVLETEIVAADVKSPDAGEVAFTVAPDQVVAKDEVVFKLNGFQRVEKRLEEDGKARLAFYQGKLDEAKVKGNAGAIAAAELKVKEKQGIVDEAQAKLDKLVAKAPVAGKAQPLAGVGAKVGAGDPVVRIGGEAVLSATFDAGAAAGAYVVDAPCQVAAKAARDKAFACVVTAVAAPKVSVRLVAAPGAPAAATEVVLLPVK